MNPGDAICILLDAHLPLVRHPGNEQCPQEDWVFRALADCYVPLLQMLRRLDNDDVPGALTIAVSPTLVTMLDDGPLGDRFQDFLRNRIQWCHEELERSARAESSLNRLAKWMLLRSESALDFYQTLPKQNVASALAAHSVAGRIELIPSVSSYAVLPLVSDGSIRRAHIRLSASFFEKRFGIRPRGILLPGLGYSPDIEDDLLAAGFSYAFASADSFSCHEGTPSSVGVSSKGMVFFGCDYSNGQKFYSLSSDWTNDHVFRASDLEDLTDLRPGVTRPHISRTVDRLGFRYHQRPRSGAPWRLYEPAVALERARQIAVELLDNQSRPEERISSGNLYAISCDAELFGYRWFEGFWFLEHLFGHAEQRAIPIVTPFTYLASSQPTLSQVALTASSAGSRGFFEDWLNETTVWVYRSLEVAQTRLNTAFRRFAGSNSPRLHRILAQGARELLLAQASDWPFMMTVGRNVGYATERLRDHLDGANALAGLAERRGHGDDGLLVERESAWPLFPGLDFRVFTQEKASPGR